MTMHEALDSYYDSFSDAEVSIIEAGEKTGKLNTALIQIADQTEKVDSITRKIKGAMSYPILLVTAMVGVVTVLMVKVIPTLTGFFGEKSNLPTATRMVVGTSDFFIANWFFIFVGVAIFIMSVSIWKKTKTGKYEWDAIMLKVPVF